MVAMTSSRCGLSAFFLVLSGASGLSFRRSSLAFASIPSQPDVFPSTAPLEHEVLGPGDVPIEIDDSSASLPLWKLAVAGGLATVIGDAFMHPIDCIKTLQQSDEGMSLSLGEAARHVMTTSGIPGFYKGLGAYVATDGVGGALKFASYEKLTKWCRTNLNEGAVLSGALLACAALAFLASSLVLVPGEFLKQQLQMSHYVTVEAAIEGTLSKHGILGLYAGYDAVFLRDIPYTVLELGLYDVFKGIFQRSSNCSLRPWQEVVSAAVAGGITALATTPLDTIKTKLMVDSYDAGFWDCFATTVETHGVGAVFAGSIARVAWIVPFTALYLPMYELLKRKLAEDTATVQELR